MMRSNRQDTEIAKGNARVVLPFASLFAFFASWRFRCWLVALFIASQSVVLSATPQKEKETAEQIVARARDEIQRKQYREAEKDLKRALKFKKEPETQLLLAVVYHDEGKSHDAVKAVKGAIKSRPVYPEANYYLARLLFEENNLKGAREAIDLAFAQGVQLPAAYVIRGHLEVLDRKYQSAVDAYKEAIRRAAPSDVGVRELEELVGALNSYLESRVHQEGGSYRRPILLNLPRPDYTEDARRFRTQGTVHLAVLVDEKGAVSSVLRFSRLGHGLDEEAIRRPANLDSLPRQRTAVRFPTG